MSCIGVITSTVRNSTSHPFDWLNGNVTLLEVLNTFEKCSVQSIFERFLLKFCFPSFTGETEQKEQLQDVEDQDVS
jgi:hypothetical protein